MKKIKIISLTFVILLCICVVIGIRTNNIELKVIKSKKELLNIYDNSFEANNILIKLFTMPFSFGELMIEPYDQINSSSSWDGEASNIIGNIAADESTSSSNGSSSSSKEYSTTNIQVENVDEADITKTDGDYIYSISGNNVIITNVKDPSEIKIEAQISSSKGIPEDLILYDNKLVVILSYQEKNQYNTIVNIYNIEDKSQPQMLKNYEIYEPYYTSRCINGKLFVISSSKLRKEDDRIVTYYYENNRQKEIDLERIKYLEGMESKDQTLISSIDLNKMGNVKMSMYLFNVENAYISENSIYLLNSDYKYNKYVVFCQFKYIN